MVVAIIGMGKGKENLSMGKWIVIVSTETWFCVKGMEVIKKWA